MCCLQFFSVAALSNGCNLTKNLKLLPLLQDFLGNFAFSVADPRLPIFVCSTCRTRMRKEVEKKTENYEVFEQHSDRRQQLIAGGRISWRNFTCPGPSCSLCQLAVQGLFGNISRQPRGRPRQHDRLSVEQKVEELGKSITVDTIRDLRVQFNLSQNVALRIARYFHKEHDVPQQSYLKRDTVALNQEFSTSFEIACDTPALTIWCVDAQAFMDRIFQLRQFDPKECVALLGIDRGDDTVKVSVSLVRVNSDGVPQAEPIGRGNFLSTGVKNLLVLGVVAAEETYDVVQTIMSGLCFQQPFKLLVDHKMKNSVLGLSGGSPIYWCDLCLYDRRDGDTYNELKVPPRTFEQCRAHYDGWVAAGRKKTNQQRFYNCTRPPMTFLPEEGLVSDIITPSGLHIGICVTSRIACAGLNDNSKACRLLMREWIEKRLYLSKFAQRDEWEGNKCALMCTPKSIAILRDMIAPASCSVSSRSGIARPSHPAKRYADALEALGNLRVACFGNSLEANARSCLNEFRECYMALNITVSCTVHVLLRHVLPFCERHQCGLGPFMEQAHESLHRDFRLMHDRVKRSSMQNPLYAPALLRSIVMYNMLHSGTGADSFKASCSGDAASQSSASSNT